MNKIKIQEVSRFLIDFFGKRFGDQRLGQAFFNIYLQKEDDPDNELFYTTSLEKATEIIFEKFVSY